MKCRHRFLTVLLCIGSLASKANPISLSCESAGDDHSRISKLAPDIVSRVNEHQLKIVTKSGTVLLVDKPPYNEPLSGVRYQFCDRRAGFLLVLMRDETQFTGQLINEETGAVTDAGEYVLMSSDRRAYFATEQPDGLDGQEWSIHAVGGKRSWSGYSFFSQRGNPNRPYAYLENPAWLPSGEFTATASCASNIEIKWTVKLVKNRGEWSWQPQRKCP